MTELVGLLATPPGSYLLAGLGGIALGWLLAQLRVVKLRTELAFREQEIKQAGLIEQEREQALTLAGERLGSAFARLASDQLKSHSETFLHLAQEHLATHHERAKGELAAREQAVERLVQPIREALQRAELQVQELEKGRREAHGTITAQLEAVTATQKALEEETRNLVSALRRPEVRGQWGEITLRRLVELAGMVEHCDFVTQSHQTTDTGSIRPDMLVHLPEGRTVVVDVKTPLDAYLDATRAPDERSKQAALGRHAGLLAERVRELAGKRYWAQFEQSPEFVILFIPGDQFLSAALEQRPALLDDALRQHVILATPTSLVALLKAIAYGWQQARLAESASEVRRLALELYERLGSFVGHLTQLGKSLGTGVIAYNRAVGSLERSVLPGARRFTDLGITPRERLPELKTIDEQTRTPRPAPDDDSMPALVDSEQDSGPTTTNEPRASPAVGTDEIAKDTQ
jgi:DNA recombination protein RmuC